MAVPEKNMTDPRDHAMDACFFGIIPDPVRRATYRLKLSQTAERLYFELWCEAARLRSHRQWTLEMPAAQMRAMIDATESAFYRALKELQENRLIRRIRQGRRANNPFREAVALTEVFAPRSAIAEIYGGPTRPSVSEKPAGPDRSDNPESMHRATTDSEPGRASDKTTPDSAPQPAHESETAEPEPEVAYDPKAAAKALGKLSSDESRLLFLTRDRKRPDLFEFASDTALTLDEQSQIRAYLAREIKAMAPPKRAPAQKLNSPGHGASCNGKGRVTPFTAAILRKRLAEEGSDRPIESLHREALWAICRGTFSSHGVTHAINVICKLVREGRWQSPKDLPAHWEWSPNEGRPESPTSGR